MSKPNTAQSLVKAAYERHAEVGKIAVRMLSNGDYRKAKHKARLAELDTELVMLQTIIDTYS